MRLIAVMPIENKTDDQQAASVFRKEMLEKLYFKGYSKVSLDTIDSKISEILEGSSELAIGGISPSIIGNVLGVDAVMYCSINECRTSYSYVYSSTAVSASFELKDAKDGKTLWSAQRSTVKRNYDITEKRLEMKSCQSYEPAFQEILNEAMATFPEGPNSSGETPPKKNWWKFW
jgi:hypothetical protein